MDLTIQDKHNGSNINKGGSPSVNKNSKEIKLEEIKIVKKIAEIPY